ncbi:unnamed protein product [Bursaphelenchus xylophilus]|uniref:(pine wood nematode) hypothetical protein n=1 Tax=Bursaphelenchus xylophilus TaxID=6326 RepID=A0A1I7S5W9_BURXY|nr:unnamed protein product [Bursaphelenchus xylophilus]CAG9082594.1 unnamed protein product [Bursaphelenchus xylophilus]
MPEGEDAGENQDLFSGDDDYGQEGDFDKVKHQALSSQFSTWTLNVIDLRFYTNHISFGFPNKNRLVIRLLKEPSKVENLSVTKEKYRQLYRLKQQEPEKWKDFLLEEEKKRSLVIGDVDEEAISLCKRVVKDSEEKIDRISFRHIYFTDPAHSELFERILSGANLKPTILELALHAEEDQWLANFVEPDIIYAMPTEMLREISSNLREIHGISKYAMSIFWEPIELQECHVHFSAFWFQHYPYKIKMKTKKMVVSDAEEYYVNDTLIDVMKVEELIYEFSLREFEPHMNVRPLENIVLRRLELKEPSAIISKIGEYENYGTYISQLLPNIKIVDLVLKIKCSAEELQKHGKNSLEKFKQGIQNMPESTECEAKVEITVENGADLSQVTSFLSQSLSTTSSLSSPIIKITVNKNKIINLIIQSSG